MKLNTFTLFVVLLLLSAVSFADDTSKRRLVLVTGEQSSITGMSNNEVRRAYLGLVDETGQKRPVPVGNHSDHLLYEVFLQKVVFMSARNFERQVLSRVYQTGNQRLRIYDRQDDVVQQLVNNPNAVSYMWDNEAKTKTNIRIVQTIWEGNVE